MIMADGRDTRIATALESYHSWFREWLDAESPTSLLKFRDAADVELGRATLQQAASRPRFEGMNCLDVTLVGNSDRVGGTAFNRLRGKNAVLMLSEETDDQLREILQAGRDINAEHGEIPASFFDSRALIPTIVEESLDFSGVAAAPAWNALQRQIDANKKKRWPDYTGHCRNSATGLASIHDAKVAENEQIAIARQRLLALGGFRVAANAATDFSRDLLKKSSS